MTDAPSRKQDQFIVRLPDGMRDRIKTSAEENSRSMNAEIVSTLDEAYPVPALQVDTEDQDKVVEMVRRDGIPRVIEKGSKTVTIRRNPDGSVSTNIQFSSEIVTLPQ